MVAASSQSRTPVTVLNYSEHPVKLYAGTRIGELSLVEIEESSCRVNNVADRPNNASTLQHREPAAVNLEQCEVTASEKLQLRSLLTEY